MFSAHQRGGELSRVPLNFKRRQTICLPSNAQAVWRQNLTLSVRLADWVVILAPMIHHLGSLT